MYELRQSVFISEIHKQEVVTPEIQTFKIDHNHSVISMSIKLSEPLVVETFEGPVRAILIQGEDGVGLYRVWISRIYDANYSLGSRYWGKFFKQLTPEELMEFVQDNCSEEVISLFLFNIDNL